MRNYFFRAFRKTRGRWYGSEQYVIEAGVGSLRLIIPSRLAWTILGVVAGVVGSGIGGTLVWILFRLGNTLSLALLLFAYSVWFVASALALLTVWRWAPGFLARHPRGVKGLAVQEARFHRFFLELPVIADDEEFSLRILGFRKNLRSALHQIGMQFPQAQ